MSPPTAAAIFAVVLVIAIGGFIVLTSYNAVVALRQRIDKAWANIDVVLKQRHDQLPNLVAAVRGLMTYERDVLTRVTEARAAYAPTAPIPDQAVTSEATSRRRPLAVRGRRALPRHQGGRPTSLDLQDEIERLESMIADRRELYNDQVYRYNTRISRSRARCWPRSSAGSRVNSSPPIRLTPSALTPTCGPRDRHQAPRDGTALWLVRHGETEWARLGRHTGRTDVPLTDAGREQARAIGRRLADHTFSLVLTSPLSRASVTADLAGFGRAAIADPDLREWDYGALEGRLTDEIRADYPGWTIWRGPWPEGETIEQVAGRADRVIARVVAADGDVLVFGHGHELRVLAALWLALPPASGGLFALGTATISILGWDRESPVVETWNEVCHLT